MIKKSVKGRLLAGMAVGAATLSAPMLTGSAQADHHMAGDKAMMGDKSMMMETTPMMVSGKVNNYWTDSSGYVTAVDLQTANGPAVVRFGPGMAMRTMQMYPVGSTADVWVKGSMENGMQKWDMVGMGNMQPTSWYPVMTSPGLSTLTAVPYVSGAPTTMSIAGKLKKLVVNDDGQVIGMILETGWLGKGAVRRSMNGQNMPGEVTWMGDKDGAPMWTLLRVPTEGMSAVSGAQGMRRKTPLAIDDEIEATGCVEAPMYGTSSPYAYRFAASALSVNGRGVGQMGFGTYRPDTKTLVNFNLNLPLISNGSSKSLPIVPLGYEVYGPTSMDMMDGKMMDGKMMSK